jgi:hypothetical protein
MQSLALTGLASDSDKQIRPSLDGRICLVGVTRLELATSRPPAVRATSCATPRSIETPATAGFSTHPFGRAEFALAGKPDAALPGPW